MEKCSFFNDVDGDRVYYAEDFAMHLAMYFTNGIFNNGLQVLADTNDMSVNVQTGSANINGYRYDNDAIKTLSIDNADGVLNRVDNIVIRLDLTNRLISTQVIKGTFAQSPVAPDLVRSSTIYDLRIAKVSIPAGTTTITQDLVTDCRFLTNDCGDVISTVQTPDTENLFIQIEQIFTNTINEMTDNFETWFQHIKDHLSEDSAGELQSEIDAILVDVEELQGNILNFEKSRTISDENVDVYKPKDNNAIESESIRFGNYKLSDILGNDTAGFHNSIFRGKDVTEYYNDGTLFTRISSGKFDDLFVGDYIVKNNVTWRIAGFDVYLHKGDTELTKHHACIVPDTNLTSGQMNSTNTTNGGYAGSTMVSTTLNNVLSTYITPVFSNHIITYRNLLTTGISGSLYNRWGTNSGGSNAWDWKDRKLDLMNENQVFGSIVWSSTGYETGSDNVQLPLFRLAPEFICNRAWYWLRSIVDSSRFTHVHARGLSNNAFASNSGGVRPCFYID